MEKNIKKDFMILHVRIGLHAKGMMFTCHENSFLVYKGLKELGYDVRLIHGVYRRKDGVNIKHSWIRYKDKILETDPLQSGINAEERFGCIIKNKAIQKRYIEFPIEFKLNKRVRDMYHHVTGYVKCVQKQKKIEESNKIK